MYIYFLSLIEKKTQPLHMCDAPKRSVHLNDPYEKIPPWVRGHWVRDSVGVFPQSLIFFSINSICLTHTQPILRS